jgi:hypothetical protein
MIKLVDFVHFLGYQKWEINTKFGKMNLLLSSRIVSNKAPTKLDIITSGKATKESTSKAL